MPTSEAIFLLTTFANMAGCRPNNEMDFIEVVTGEIFEVGFSPAYCLAASLSCKQNSVALGRVFVLIARIINLLFYCCCIRSLVFN